MIGCAWADSLSTDLTIKIMQLCIWQEEALWSNSNANEPISKIINSISSLALKNNFMKLYNLEAAAIGYTRDIANAVNLNGKIEYQQRKPLFNNTTIHL
jgi:hypothetical protein